ncbi:MAG: fibronectin type III domain-containing protein [Elusimicrobia bacterium]|nr:fibronectin type III domain-containing protein [Elusimicrobiota bacterium]
MKTFFKSKNIVFVFFVIFFSSILNAAPPTVPNLYSPSTMTWTNINTIDWSTSTALAGQTVFYDLEIDDAQDFVSVVASSYTIYRSSCLISNLNGSLSENTQYWWHVRASTSTSGEYSAWSSTRSFKLDTTKTVFSYPQVKLSTGTWAAANTAYVNVSTPQVRVNVQDINSGLMAGKTEIVASSGCVGLWHLNEGSGATVYDASGYGNNGTITQATWQNMTSWKSTTKTEKTLYFLDDNDNVDCGSGASFANLLNKITLSVWARRTGGLLQPLAVARIGDWRFGCETSAGNWNFYTAAWTWVFPTGVPVAANEWHHMVFTYDGATAKIYKDGALAVQKAASGNLTTNGNVAIGGWATVCFTGYLDEVGIWDRVLDPEEIAVLYNSCAVKFSSNTVSGYSGIITSTSTEPTVLTTGSDGTTTLQFSTATAVNFLPGSNNSIQFLARDSAGNLSMSGVYTINVDTISPSAITSLTGLTSSSNINLSWISPGTDGTVGAIDNGQFLIRRATWSVTPESMWGNGYDTKPAVIEQEIIIDTTSLPALSNCTTTFYDLQTSVIHYFRIWSRDTAGNWSSISNGCTVYFNLPTAPTNFTGVTLSTYSIQWSWNDVSDESGYRVRYSTASSSSEVAVSSSLPANQVSWTEYGLTANTSYYRVVVSTNASGESNLSNAATTYTFANPPLAPVVFSNVGYSSVTVQWTATDNPSWTKYGIILSSNPECYGATVSTAVTFANNLTNNTTSVFSLNSETTYYFRIIAFNNEQIQTTYIQSSTTTKTGPPAAPSNIKISALLGPTSIYWQFDDNSTNETGLFLSSGTDITMRLSPNLANTATTGTTYWIELDLSTNTQYTRYAEAVNATDSSWSVVITSYTAAYVPSNLTLSNVYSSSATLTWSANTNPNGTRYGVISSSNPECYGATVSTAVTFANNLTANTTSVLSLNSDTTYYFRVIAFNGNQIQSSSYVQSSTTTKSSVVIPNRPINLKSASLGTTSIYWQFDDNSTNETGLYFSSGTNITMRLSPNLANTTTTGTTYWLELGLSTNTQYTRYAEAYNTAGSSWSVIITSYTAAYVPSNLTLSNVCSSSATLTWSANTNPNGTRYGVILSSNPECYGATVSTAVTFANNLTANTTPVSSLSSETIYYFRVIAYNGDQIQTAYIQSSTITKPSAAPATPTNLKVSTLLGPTSIYWQFNDNSTNETGLYLSSGTNITMRLSPNLANTATTGTTYWLELGLSANTLYTRYAEAVNAAGSAWSVVIASYTAASVPSNITFANVHSSSVTLSWSANTNPNGTRYGVAKSTNSEFTGTEVSSITYSNNLTLTTTTFYSLSLNTSYYFRVWAYNGNQIPTTYVQTSTITKSGAPPNAPVISVILPGEQTTIKVGDTITLAAAIETSATLYKITVKDLDGNTLAEWLDPAGLTSNTINGITLDSATENPDNIIADITIGNITAKYPMLKGITVEIIVQDNSGISQPGISEPILISAETNKITLYNNLFNPVKGDKTTIRYETKRPGRITIEVYTINGDKVITLVNETTTSAVPYWATWDGKDSNGDLVSSGIYLVHIEGPGLKDTKKVCVIK